MRVALVTALELAEVGLVRRMHVHVLLAVRAVGETAIAALEFTSERLFTFFLLLNNTLRLDFLLILV